jgi:hypothetical protein
MGIMDLEHFFYNIQHKMGIQPKWEKDLIANDYQLRIFLEWKKSKRCCPSKCEELYHNRLNYLKGWINKE